MIFLIQKNKKLVKAICFYSTLQTSFKYNNVIEEKYNILKDNRGKCGIYKWTNKMNGRTYIGGSINLGSRFSEYLSINFLIKKTLISKSKIYNALLTNKYSNFTLEILEYCDKFIVINREQYYIDKYKPEYNILTKAGSSLGFKHYEETISKFKLRKWTKESLIKSSISYTIIVKNVNTSYLTEFYSIRSAARKFEVSPSTILCYLNKNKLFKNKYIITRKVDN